MTKVIGVRFKANGKSYYFSPGDLDSNRGTTLSWKRPGEQSAAR